jgi:hypothetical protein
MKQKVALKDKKKKEETLRTQIIGKTNDISSNDENR